MRHRVGLKTGHIAMVLAVIAIMMISLLGAIIPVASVSADTGIGTISNSCYSYGGVDYSWAGGTYLWDGTNLRTWSDPTPWTISGEENISCGLYRSVHNISVWYEVDNGASLVAYMTGHTYVCIAYADDLAVTR